MSDYAVAVAHRTRWATETARRIIFRSLLLYFSFLSHCLYGVLFSSASTGNTCIAPAYRLTRNPDENWNLGDGLREETKLGKKWKEEEKQGWKTVDLEEVDRPLAYKLLISAVVPRPIAFVATLSETGIQNLAPFSYFSLVSHNPPLVSISFTIPSKGVKDTRENIKTTKQFTVNIISEPFIEAANATSIDAPPEVDEFVVSGLTPLPSDVVKPPRVQESAASFECELFHFLDVSPSGVHPVPSSFSPTVTTTVILGRILRVHVRHSVLSSDGQTIDPALLRAVSRLGGVKYARIGEGFELARPNWKEDGRAAKDLSDRKRCEVEVEGELNEL